MIHNHAVVIAVALAAVGLLVMSRGGREPGPVYVTRRSPVMALGALLAGAAAFMYARKHAAPGSTASAPQPSTVTHTITQQVTRYVPVHNWPVSGLELTLLGLAAIAAAVLIVRQIGRYWS